LCDCTESSIFVRINLGYLKRVLTRKKHERQNISGKRLFVPFQTPAIPNNL
jgi:hypothetical protein